jgi:hypothetical protein
MNCGLNRTEALGSRRHERRLLPWATVFALCFSLAVPLHSRDKEGVQYGAGLIVNVPYPEAEVVQAVQDVVQSGIIRGTKEYNKDEYITGAEAASSTRAFGSWDEGGKVFYKVRAHAVDPRNFKDSSDVGTLAVRYVVQAQDEKNTVVRIQAVFVEDFRHTVHPSNGSVEGAEYKDIHDRLDALKLMKETGEADIQRNESARKSSSSLGDARLQASPASRGVGAKEDAGAASAPRVDANPPAVESLEQHVRRLRQEVERRVKAPGAALKSAPFHSATTLKSLPTGTEVLIVISTTYWVGIETHDGQHGWMSRDDLEQLP